MGDFLDDRDFYLHQLAAEEFMYLRSRPKEHKCLFCKRRLGHKDPAGGTFCPGESLMPFGKHKGVPLHLVPQEYREWIVNNHVGSERLLDEVAESLGLVYHRRTEEELHG